MRGGWFALFVAAAPSAALGQAVNLEATGVTGPAEMVAGRTYTVQATLQVTGPVTSTGWTVLLAPRGVVQGALSLGPFAPSAVAPGEVVLTAQALVPPGTAGLYHLAVALDPAQAVPEANRLDNVWVSPAPVLVRAPTPNLRVVQVEAQDPRRRPGDALGVDFVLVNDGEAAATVEVAAFLSDDEVLTPADPQVAVTQVTVPAGGQTAATLSGPVPADLEAGPYVLGLIADPQGQAPELSEVDNVGLAALPLIVYFDTLTLETSALLPGTVGLAYSVRLDARGGDGAYVFRVASGALPDGLTLADGLISGVPTRSGPFALRVEVDGDGKVDGKDYQVAVARDEAPLRIVSAGVTPGFLNMPYEQVLIAGGGEPPYDWDLAMPGGVLPPGLDLSPAGLITGVPNTLGTFSFTVTVEDRLGNRDERTLQALVTSATNVIILPAPPEPLPVGEPVDLTLEAAGGTLPYAWTALSPPPPGLAFSELGRLTGTPSRVGRWPMWVEVEDASSGPASDTALIQLEVADTGAFTIVTTALPDAVTRQRYGVVLEATGGAPPLRWTLAPGSVLPQEFYLVNGDGDQAPIDSAYLYGVALDADHHAFTVRVDDAYGRRREMIYALTVERVQVDVAQGCRGVDPSGAPLWLLLLGGIALRRRA